MKHPGRKGRVTREQWVAEALDALQEEGPEAINIQSLSRRLNISKTSFYWHFKDRSELIDSMIEYWIHELTEVVTKNQEVLSAPPTERLMKTIDMIEDYGLAHYDMAFRFWAKTEPRAMKALLHVNQIRMQFIGSTIAELGFANSDLEMRTALFVCYQTAEQFVFPELNAGKRRAMRKKRLELILGS